MAIIPGGVMGWMVAWGVWTADSTQVESTPNTWWLPGATGSMMHRVDQDTVEFRRARAVCSLPNSTVSLVCKAPLSPGDLLDPEDKFLSADNWYVWQAVGAALEEFTALRDGAWCTSPDDVEGYRSVEWAMGTLVDVARGRIFRQPLPTLARGWQAMPAAGRHLLAWLIVAGANGLERCCLRCERLAARPGPRGG